MHPTLYFLCCSLVLKSLNLIFPHQSHALNTLLDKVIHLLHDLICTLFQQITASFSYLVLSPHH